VATFQFPEIAPSGQSPSIVSNTAVSRSPWGAVKTEGRGEQYLRYLMTFSNLSTADRRLMMSYLSRLNGMQHRASIRDFSYSGPTGSLSISDLHPALVSANYSGAAWQINTDISGGVRVKRAGNTTNGTVFAPTSNSITVAGLSYAFRTAVVSYSDLQSTGRVSYITSSGGPLGDLFDSGSIDHITGVYVAAFTASNTGVQAALTDNIPLSGSGFSQFDLLRSELARCLMVDNGFNAVTRSQEFDHADWAKVRATVTANAATAPDGTTTADELVEDSTASATHHLEQSYARTSVIEYWTGSVHFEANTSQRMRIIIDDGANNFGSAFFDATLGTISEAASTNGTATNSYATIHDLGGGRFRARLSVRLPASTSVRFIIYLCDGANNIITFNGDGSSGLYLWGAQLQRGGQLGRYTPTTTTAFLGANQTGKSIWLKGLDSNADGQLLAGDQIQIGSQLLRLDADLDGDASGIGLATISSRIRVAPADEAACVLYRPQGVFMLSKQESSWRDKPGIFSDFSVDMTEDFSA